MTFASLASSTNTRAVQRNTPINLVIPGREADQVANSAGGISFLLDNWSKLQRFLILGTEGGTAYASEQAVTSEGLTCIKALLAENGRKVVDIIVDVSSTGRAKNNDYALLALAMCMSLGYTDTKQYAGYFLDKVARTGTHLQHFVAFVNGLRGWGSILKRSVANWYNSKNENQVAYQAIKYQSRDGWGQRDVLRLSHPKADTELRNNVYKYIVKGAEGLAPTDTIPSIIAAFEQAKTADEATLIRLILEHRLSHEMIPNEMKNRPAVWEALAQHMGSTALIRNLNKLTALGMLNSQSSFAQSVILKLTDVERLKADRVHPMSVLIAQRQYAKGHGDKGSLIWTPSRQITDALEFGFYNSFQAVEPSGKNFMLAIDVSGSMKSACVGANITCHEGATVMAMITARREPNSYIFGFADRFKDLGITSEDTLASACAKTTSYAFGATNCSLPMQTALDNGWDIDCFSVYTDNETNQGRNHPSQALQNYRNRTGKHDAKLVSVGMRMNGFSIADPRDKGMLDVAGFDTATPRIISEFAKGNI
jgi:60 kDa SS-A/Ro ribonucleoprotein